MKIKCVTLFDITKTGMGRRYSVTKETTPQEFKSRNQQINFETMLQIVGMRCQPENISTPKIVEIDSKDSRWGKKYNTAKSKTHAWEFTFDVYHKEVFNDGADKLGNLYKDSSGVPMIIKLDESQPLSSQINTDGDYKNIHYEILEDDEHN